MVLFAYPPPLHPRSLNNIYYVDATMDGTIDAVLIPIFVLHYFIFCFLFHLRFLFYICFLFVMYSHQRKTWSRSRSSLDSSPFKFFFVSSYIFVIESTASGNSHLFPPLFPFLFIVAFLLFSFISPSLYIFLFFQSFSTPTPC